MVVYHWGKYFYSLGCVRTCLKYSSSDSFEQYPNMSIQVCDGRKHLIIIRDVESTVVVWQEDLISFFSQSSHFLELSVTAVNMICVQSEREEHDVMLCVCVWWAGNDDMCTQQAHAPVRDDAC